MSEYDGIERRKGPTWEEEIDRLEGMITRRYELDEEMHKTTSEMLHQISVDMKDVKEVVVAWTNMKGAVAVLIVVGRIAKWFTIVGGAIGAFYLAIKHGLK